MQKYIGESSKQIANIFVEAITKYKESKKGVIIIIDEIDRIATNVKNEHKDEHLACLQQLRIELDKCENNPNIFVVGITNFKDSLDPLLLDRFGNNVIEHNNPSFDTRQKVLRFYFNRAAFLILNDEAINDVIDIMFKLDLNFKEQFSIRITEIKNILFAINNLANSYDKNKDDNKEKLTLLKDFIVQAIKLNDNLAIEFNNYKFSENQKEQKQKNVHYLYSVIKAYLNEINLYLDSNISIANTAAIKYIAENTKKFSIRDLKFLTASLYLEAQAEGGNLTIDMIDSIIKEKKKLNNLGVYKYKKWAKDLLDHKYFLGYMTVGIAPVIYYAPHIKAAIIALAPFAPIVIPFTCIFTAAWMLDNYNYKKRLQEEIEQ